MKKTVIRLLILAFALSFSPATLAIEAKAGLENAGPIFGKKKSKKSKGKKTKASKKKSRRQTRY